jgi:hypothetical protein
VPGSGPQKSFPIKTVLPEDLQKTIKTEKGDEKRHLLLAQDDYKKRNPKPAPPALAKKIQRKKKRCRSKG